MSPLAHVARAIPMIVATAALSATDLDAQSMNAQAGQVNQPGPMSNPLQREPIAPYRVLDNVEGPYVNLNVFPVRPMVFSADQAHLYAVNTHDSVVQHYPNLLGQPTDTFRTPWGPVSIALWPATTEDELLVVCGGSHVLARLDRLSGALLSMVDLPFEPADILVDHTRDRAFIACSGADLVAEVDLITNEVAATYTIPGKHPVFLSDGGGGTVLVAPQLSGNNSFPVGNGAQAFHNFPIIDGETNQFVVAGLPDEDLFRIDPLLGTVEPVLVDVGTILFAHGINPVTGDFWQLNTEANNKDDTKQSEPAIRGESVFNRLTISTLPAAGAGTSDVHTVIELDDTDPGLAEIQYDPTRTVGLPYSLEFDASGNGLVTGLLTDNVTGLAPDGSFITEFDVAPGSIPRQTIIWGNSFVFVYCWGTNVIELWNLGGGGWTQTAVLDLGHDPTPDDIAAGRQVFYDASHSLHNNASCASCHIEGKTDMLAWDLSDLPKDDKGPMVTQTLSGINQTPPFHWRGERLGLIDFNGAFDGLLGGVTLDLTPGGEFDDFEAFVLSLATTANPHQDRRRMVTDRVVSVPPAGFPVGSAVRGQDLFFDEPTDGASTCEFCHTLPTSTSGDTQATSANDPIPQRTSVEVTHFKELWRKDQPLVTVEFVNQITAQVPLLGSGLTHAGLIRSLHAFVDLFAISDQETQDIFEFINTLDQGLAPLVHQAEHLNAATHPVAFNEIVTLFMPQARERQIDVVVFGTVDLGLGVQELGWYFDRDIGLFVSEDSTMRRDEHFFLQEAEAGRADVVFVGLPVGSGERFGVDFDEDGLYNLDELALGTGIYDPDSDDDGAPDGHEVRNGSNPLDDLELPLDGKAPTVRNFRLQWITAKVAKLAWETDEPTTYSIDFSTSVGSVRNLSSTRFEKTHTAILANLLPSTLTDNTLFTYTGTLTVTDLDENETIEPLPTGMTTKGLAEVPGEVFLGELHWTLEDSITVASELHGVADARVDEKISGPPHLAMEDYVVVATVLVNNVQSATFTSPNPTAFTMDGDPPLLQGPFVIANPTGPSGVATLDFTQPGLTTGDVVRLNIVAVVPIDPDVYDPLAPDFVAESVNFPLGLWDFPSTPAAFRALESTH